MGSSPLKALMILLCFMIIGCSRTGTTEEIAVEKLKAPVAVISEADKVPICTQGTYGQKLARVRLRGPKLASLISRLYREAGVAPTPPAKLVTFIKVEHDKQPRVSDISRATARQYAYGAVEYSKRFGVDRDRYVSIVTHENHWVNTRGDTSRKGVPQPRFLWSWGLGQVQYRTAKQSLDLMGCTGLIEQDLIDFPLLNLYIVGKVLGYKLSIHKTYTITIQSYNAGDNGWQDGRSKGYLDKVMAVYNRRAEWSSSK